MADRRVRELLGQMQKTLECSICLEMMTNPVSTGCGHQFCRFCLMEFLERKRWVPCPLCKKRITKRSLVEREQLGDMVDGVRNLIAAFQKDTGTLFSPPRGPQVSALPGTPESIQAQSAATSNQRTNRRRSNVRQSIRKDIIEQCTEIASSSTASSERLAQMNEVSHIECITEKQRTKAMPATVMENNSAAPVSDEEARQLKLLKYIEEGIHCPDESLKDAQHVNNAVGLNDVSTAAIESMSTCASVTILDMNKRRHAKKPNRNRKRKVKITECTLESDVDINAPINAAVIDDKQTDRHVVENSYVKVNDTDYTSGGKKDLATMTNCAVIDADGIVLSGTSLGKVSESSSGPLFKTPVDICRQHKEAELDISENGQEVKRLLRSRGGKVNYDEIDADVNSVITLTPDLLVKETVVGKTYSRRDQDSYKKKKTASRKVTEWLENISTISGSDKTNGENDNKNTIECIKTMDKNQQKKLNKKSLKVQQEEEAMGKKIKNLAKQVQGNAKSLLFEFDDFENTNDELQVETVNTEGETNMDVEVLEHLDVDHYLEHEPEYIGALKEVIQLPIGTIIENPTMCDDMEIRNNARVSIEVSNVDNTENETNIKVKPVFRKRIFKSRINSRNPASNGCIAEQATSENINKVMLEIEKGKDVNGLYGKEIVTVESQESDLPCSDPYEFKSSQNTPKKVGKTKGKRKKKNGKLTTKGKGQCKSKNIPVPKAIKDFEVENNIQKKWNRSLVPAKTILKSRHNVEEIDKMAASLQQAEDYDLLTCTQDAAESIAKQQKENGTRRSDQTGSLFERLPKLDCVHKKVRFTEPVMSDFIQTGKIDIIGYRKAKELFSAADDETLSKHDNKKRQQAEVEVVTEKEGIYGDDRGNPLVNGTVEDGKSDENNSCKDADSDDLSEDYRFHDDSSGTDDLDIKPTQEEFEKPNLEIQPEEIKAQLSQAFQDHTGFETPLIPINKDSPQINIIEGIPAIFTVPKFNRAPSKPARKARKLGNGTKACPVETAVDAVVEMPRILVDDGSEIVVPETPIVIASSVEDEVVIDVKKVREDKPKSITRKYEVVIKTRNLDNRIIEIDKHASKLSTDSVETRSPDVEMILTPNAETSMARNESVELQLVDGQELFEPFGATMPEFLSSESILTQNSESILQVKVSPAKPTETNNITYNKETSMIKSSKTSQKKKRKSFMLEESLDFGSLDDSGVVAVNEDSECMNQAKRQRVNRLRRSPKNKECFLKEKDSVVAPKRCSGNAENHICTANNTIMKSNVTLSEVEICEAESYSADIIPDTVVTTTSIDYEENCEQMKLPASVETISSTELAVDDVPKNGKDVKHKGKVYKENTNDNTNSSQFITLSSDSVSGSSLSNECRQKHKQKNLNRSPIKNVIKSPLRGDSNAFEIVDIVGETQMTDSEMVENVIDDSNNISDTFKSPGNRKKCKSGELQSELNNDLPNNVIKIKHLSGMLVSPQESLVQPDMKASLEDIFQMDSEMPSVDLSPEEETIRPIQFSHSLDLGSLHKFDSVVKDDNTLEESLTNLETIVQNDSAMKQIEQAPLILNETNEKMDEINFGNMENTHKQNSSCNSLCLTTEILHSKQNPTMKDVKSDEESCSSPEVKKRRSNVKAVRGFSRKKRLMEIGANRLSSSDASSMNSVIPATLETVSAVKYRSPVTKFRSPQFDNIAQNKVKTNIDVELANTNLDQGNINPRNSGENNNKAAVEKLKQADTPIKKLKEINVSKYSPSLRKQHKKEIEMNKRDEFAPEVVELKHYGNAVDDIDGEDYQCIHSPNGLPDLDNNMVVLTSVKDCVMEGKSPNYVKFSDVQQANSTNRKSKVSPKLVLKLPEKEVNGHLLSDENDENNGGNKITNLETMSIVEGTCGVNELPQHSDKFESDDNFNLEIELKSQSISQSSVNYLCGNNALVKDDENSVTSSTSSEFRLVPFAEEESPEKQALCEINKFDEIVLDSLDLRSQSLNGLNKIKSSLCTTVEVDSNPEKNKRKSRMANSLVEMTSKENKKAKEKKQTSNMKKKRSIDSEDMYSTRIDSSPLSGDVANIKEESEAVVLESDLDDKDNDEENLHNEVVNCDVEIRLLHNDDDDDDDDDDEAVVRRKGVKRAILSDSSEDDDDSSRHMNMTSSSAFSSQSENLTTQERYSLEKEVERMAREMAAMKDQLRKSKELKQTKPSGSKYSPKPVIVEAPDEVFIENIDSDTEDKDIFLSQPPVSLSDLHSEDSNAMETENVCLSQPPISPDGRVNGDGDIVKHIDDADMEVESESTAADETVQPKYDSMTMPSDTVPESDPSQLSLPAFTDFGTSQLARRTLPEIDVNDTYSSPGHGKRQHIGIVVTSLNQSQIQQTMKLAALNDAKFFTKFNQSVTHVVVKPADGNETMCDRTLKFFQGVARKCWIVSYFWVSDSRQAGYLLPEGPYEIQGDTANTEVHYGPKRSRLSKDYELFQQFEFSLIGGNTFLSKDSMKDLIRTCGGSVLNIAQLGDGRTRSLDEGHITPLVISCTDMEDEVDDQEMIVKYARDIYNGLGIATVTREWILDSLTVYRIQPIHDYVVTDLPNLKLPQI